MAEPLLVSLVSDVETPVSLYHKLHRKQPVSFLFESAEGDRRVARFSFIGVSPVLSVRLKDGSARIEHHLEDTVEACDFTDPMRLLQDLQTQAMPDAERTSRIADFPFTGG